MVNEQYSANKAGPEYKDMEEINLSALQRFNLYLISTYKFAAATLGRKRSVKDEVAVIQKGMARLGKDLNIYTAIEHRYQMDAFKKELESKMTVVQEKQDYLQKKMKKPKGGGGGDRGDSIVSSVVQIGSGDEGPMQINSSDIMLGFPGATPVNQNKSNGPGSNVDINEERAIQQEYHEYVAFKESIKKQLARDGGPSSLQPINEMSID